jgi:hypothetical protein
MFTFVLQAALIERFAELDLSLGRPPEVAEQEDGRGDYEGDDIDHGSSSSGVVISSSWTGYFAHSQTGVTRPNRTSILNSNSATSQFSGASG